MDTSGLLQENAAVLFGPPIAPVWIALQAIACNPTQQHVFEVCHRRSGCAKGSHL
jgi:hypothetical protein